MGMNPVAWRGASGGEATIKELTTAEIKELAYVVLSKIATTDGVGTVNVSTNTSLTLVGTFEDTYRNAGSGTIASTTYQIRQNLTTDYPETTPPNFYYAANSAYPLTESNTSVYQTLADNILYYCTIDEGPNSYRLATSSPATTYGGTWSIVDTISDIRNSGEAGITYNLYKRIDNGAYTPQRPLKRGTGSGSLNQFTDTDINNIARIVRQRIKDSGIGTYSFGETAPVTGTWSAVGTINNTIENADAGYVTDYTSTDVYTGTTYSGPVEYTGVSDTTFAAPTVFSVTYSGPQAFTGSISYSGTSQYANPIYSGPQAFSATYFGPVDFFIAYTSDLVYGGAPTYTGVDGPNSIVFNDVFLGLGAYTSDLSYTGPIVYVGNFYIGPQNYSQIYTVDGPVYTFEYVGTAITYTGTFTTFSGGPLGVTPYTGSRYVQTDFGTIQYTSDVRYTLSFLGFGNFVAFPFNPPYTLDEGGVWTALYDGLFGYTSGYTALQRFQADYIGDDLGTQYTSSYLNEDVNPFTLPYTGDNVNPYSGTYTNENAIAFTPIYTGDDALLFTLSYTADILYTGQVTTLYTADDVTQFGLTYTIDPLYSTEYVSQLSNYAQAVPPGAVGPYLGGISTLITQYLWRRVA